MTCGQEVKSGVLLVLVLFLCCTVSSHSSKSNLIGENVKISNVSVSGISGGGYFAVQMQVAFSKSLIGSGIVAAGPYYCAQSDIEIALNTCMEGKPSPSASLLAAETQNLAYLGFIDSPGNLKQHRVYVYSGSRDTVVRRPVADALIEYFSGFVAKENLRTELNIPSEHAMITYDYGNSCDTLGEPYISHCSGSGRIQVAHELIKHIYSAQYPNQSLPTNTSNLHQFDQHEFISPFEGFQKTGFVYIPTRCKSPSSETVCSIHVAFHGCLQGSHFIDTQFVMSAGYNDIAEALNIIVIYPQVEPTNFPYNPKGCFDWWGYTNPTDYFVKAGPQMYAVKKMIQYFGAQFFDA